MPANEKRKKLNEQISSNELDKDLKNQHKLLQKLINKLKFRSEKIN